MAMLCVKPKPTSSKVLTPSSAGAAKTGSNIVKKEISQRVPSCSQALPATRQLQYIYTVTNYSSKISNFWLAGTAILSNAIFKSTSTGVLLDPSAVLICSITDRRAAG